VTVICTALLPSARGVACRCPAAAAGGSVVGAGRHERVGAADDLADLLGDLGLPGLVRLPERFFASSSALSEADFMARRRDADSDAADSSIAAKIRVVTYLGSRASSRASGEGSNS
jgi:hypothetical protein